MPQHLVYQFRHVFVLVAVASLLSCSGGTSVTAGVGGSGIGGTGITHVRGNVTQVVSLAPDVPNRTLTDKLFAVVTKLLAPTANAQTISPDGITSLVGIQVSGGGKSTFTDGNGRFDLADVTPSQSFVLTFTSQSGQSASLPIGPVTAGSQISVNNVILNTSNGTASAENVIMEESDDAGGDGANNNNSCSSNGPQGNQGNQENQGNQCNEENQGNEGNQGNQDNRGNLGDQGNLGSSKSD